MIRPPNDTRLRRAFLGTLRPPPDLTICEWAERHRYIPQGVSPEAGLYRADRVPYQREPQEQIGRPDVQEVILCCASQTMKTTILENTIGYFVAAEPSPILVKYPTLEQAKGFSVDKFMPTVRATPVLSELIHESGKGTGSTASTGNTILQKTFPGGYVAFVGANSPSGLRRRSCRVVIQDEIDADPASAGSEGDPQSLADRRAQNYHNAVKVKASTPTVAGMSPIWKLLEHSDWREWHVPCPHCGHEQTLTWDMVQVERDSENRIRPETAHLQCRECGEAWSEMDRIRAINTGRWKPRNLFKGRCGYHLNGLYRVMGSKEQFAGIIHEAFVEFLEAKSRGPEAVKAWTNTFLCEPYEEVEERISETDVIDRAEWYDPQEAIPDAVLRITGGADIQGDRIECEFIGWGEDEESWGLGYFVLHGDPEKAEVWEELDRLIERRWKFADGRVIKCDRFFVDTGYKQDRVLKWTGSRRGRGIYACRGVTNAGALPAPLLPKMPSVNNRRKVPVWNIGVTSAKTVIYDRLTLPTPGISASSVPSGASSNTAAAGPITSTSPRPREPATSRLTSASMRWPL